LTLANRQSGGTSPVSSDFLNIMVRIGAISGASSFRIFGRMLSGPAALLRFNFCNSLSTHAHVMLISGAV